jgi:hypothetical protein
MLSSDKAPAPKKRKRTVTQILREAYACHCRDRATRDALRRMLKRSKA